VRHLARFACIMSTMMPPGIDLRNMREVSGAHSEFRGEIRDAPRVGRLRARPNNSVDQCCHATAGRGCSQFWEMFEATPVAEPPPARLLPTLPWRATVGSAAADFAGCWNQRSKPTASSYRCHPRRANGIMDHRDQRHGNYPAHRMTTTAVHR